MAERIDNEQVAQELESLATLVRRSSVRYAEFDSEAGMVDVSTGKYVEYRHSGLQTHKVELRLFVPGMNDLDSD